MPNLFQLTAEHIDRSDTLEAEDIGKWCFVLNGCFQGFWTDYEEAQKAMKQIFNK